MRICSVEGCDRKHVGNGLCGTHRYRVNTHGTTDKPIRKKNNYTACKIDGCSGQGILKPDGTYQFPLGYCNAHYRKFLKYGDPLYRKVSNGENRKQDPLYKLYCRIRRRVHNKNCSEYQFYGALGVVLCLGWDGVDGFSHWRDDMGPRPEETSIDRIDVYGNYSCGHCEECIENNWPMNCRWATDHVQASNRRKSNKDVGVCWDPSRERYRANLNVNNKLVFSKRFKTYEEAVCARKEAELKYLGYYVNGDSIENS